MVSSVIAQCSLKTHKSGDEKCQCSLWVVKNTEEVEDGVSTTEGYCFNQAFENAQA